MKNILFICTGNTCRSPMAEYLFNHKVFLRKLDNKYRAYSAGVSVCERAEAAKHAKGVLKDMGIDASGHYSKQAQSDDIARAYLVLCMSVPHAKLLRKQFAEYRDKIFSISEYVDNGTDIADPYGGEYEIYKKTAKQLDDVCNEIINKLEDMKQ